MTALVLMQVLVSGISFSVMFRIATFAAQSTENTDIKGYIYIGFTIGYILTLVLIGLVTKMALHPVTQAMCISL
ncbi:hypothetical protein [Pseudobacillus wudalianchiensis]|uniref:hypothetical protein n=1 Tax=Pseudobacillus wudalianchiensis TaxID=1743143 RepID=UPI001C40120B|nr:hypothetical protein [Bacillus wudalianchiensis]